MSAVTTQGVVRASTATVVGISAAAALVPLNSTMIAVALPAIGDDLHVGTRTVSALVTLYLAVMLVGQPLAGRISDRLGSRRTVRIALWGVAAASAAGALATAFPVLVAARAVQAVFAAALGPATQSLLSATTPPDERGRVFGLMGSVMGAGAASGPIVGGALVAGFGWEAIFAVNVPIALVALAAARSAGTSSGAEAAGAVPPRAPDRPAGGRISNPVFVAGFAAQALSTQAQYALLILTPIVLNARGWGSAGVGLALSALTIGMIVAGPAGGRAGDEHGRRLPSAAGLVAATAAVASLAVAGPGVAPVLLVVALTVFGVGLGVVTPNLMSAALGSVPPGRTGAAAGVFSMGRYVGSIVTSILVGVLVADDASGTSAVLATSTGCMVAAAVAARWLPPSPPRAGAAVRT